MLLRHKIILTDELGFEANLIKGYFLNALPDREIAPRIYYQPVSDPMYSCKDYFMSEEHFLEVHALVMELVGNAFRHGNRYDPSKKATFNIYRGKNGVVFEIKDEGEGIPFDLIEHVMRGESPFPDKDIHHNGTQSLLKCLREDYIIDIGFSEDRKSVYFLVPK
jgi:hypothetical protein